MRRQRLSIVMSAHEPHANQIFRPTITLQLGGQAVVETLVSTLTSRSGAFAACLSDLSVLPKDEAGNPTIFVDVDPEVFKHVLSYMRSTRMPLIWTSDRGFDLSMYSQVAAVARKLQIDELHCWIVERRYEHAVKTTLHYEKVDLPPGHNYKTLPIPSNATAITTTSTPSFEGYQPQDRNPGTVISAISWKTNELIPDWLAEPSTMRPEFYPSTSVLPTAKPAHTSYDQHESFSPFVQACAESCISEHFQSICFHTPMESPEEARLKSYELSAVRSKSRP